MVPDGLVRVFKKNADLLGFPCTAIPRVYGEWSEKEKISSERQLCGWKCLVDVRGKRWIGRLVRDDRKATVTIATRYNQGKQNTISERTTRWTLKQMGYSSRRPHRVPLLSTKNRKLEAPIRTGSPKLDKRRLEKRLPGLMSLDFCCIFQMVGSEFGIKNMNAWINPALSQRFRLLVVVYHGLLRAPLG